jgi:hypothetical protein
MVIYIYIAPPIIAAKTIPNQKSLYEYFVTINPIIMEIKIKINEPVLEENEDRNEKGITKSIKPNNI